ncbi:MAG TPA: SPFH domain-containing protein [Planktothrix sp.]|jgi:regulator of protease activity HflC (stomatin/prohibitin superfamily)
MNVIIWLTIVLLLLRTCVRFSLASERLVIMRSGKPVRMAGPGWVFIIPFGESTKRVTTSETRLPLPAISIENVAGAIADGYYMAKVVDPVKYVRTNATPDRVRKIVHDQLFSLVANASLKDCLTGAALIEQLLLEGCNEKAKLLGVTVTRANLNFPAQKRVLREMLYAISTLLYLPELMAKEDAVPLLIEQQGRGETVDMGNKIEMPDLPQAEYKFGL